MQEFTLYRTITTPDEIWIVEHPSVYTQGRHGNPEHILDTHGMLLVQSDRGGQVTYHGPGQLVVYFLVDLKRLKLGIKTFVANLESSIIDFLADFDIVATTIAKQPGVYVNGAKIASVGLRVKRGCTYHGIALNVAMDLTPFNGIHPCGYPGLLMTQMVDWAPNMTLNKARQAYGTIVKNRFSDFSITA